MSYSGEGISPKAMAVATHEQGHLFDLPDFYNYDHSNGAHAHGGSMVLGIFSLMAGGGLEYLDKYPSNMSPYSKMFLGWLTYTVVPRTLSDEWLPYMLRPAESFP